MNNYTITPIWQKRNHPLSASGLWVSKHDYDQWMTLLLTMSESRMLTLSIVATAQGYLILGNDDNLPWLSPAIWLGYESSTQSILWPTLWETNVNGDILETICLQKYGQVAVVYEPTHQQTLVVPLDVQRSLRDWYMECQYGS